MEAAIAPELLQQDAVLASQVRECLRVARAAQVAWGQMTWPVRRAALERLPGLLTKSADQIVRSVVRPAADLGEIASGELLPLAEACRFLAKRGGRVLEERKLPRRDGVWWMGRVDVVERREPWGVVLVIGPSNYPLLLPGVQAIQAIAAGNAVLIKPAPQCEEVMRLLVDTCVQAGVPEGLLQLLPSTPLAGQLAIDEQVDKVVFTGSSRTGRSIASRLAEGPVPATLELSGCDAVFVLPSADLDRVAKTVSVALQMNGGETCIAPRRLFATREVLDSLIGRIRELLAEAPPRCIHKAGFEVGKQLLDDAISSGATIAVGSQSAFQSSERCRPIVLDRVQASMPIAQSDIFAPILSLVECDNVEEALEKAGSCSYALGASVFGGSGNGLESSMKVARQISAGCITIDDIVVPSADPRVSFGGWNASGYGVTRGLEGLREMTRLKVICIRRGKWLPHLTTPSAQLLPLMLGILRFRHGSTWRERWRGMQDLWNAVRMTEFDAAPKESTDSLRKK